MTAEQLKEYMTECQVWFGIVPMNDLFFLPPGLIYVESVVQEDHVFVSKLGYLPISMPSLICARLRSKGMRSRAGAS